MRGTLAAAMDGGRAGARRTYAALFPAGLVFAPADVQGWRRVWSIKERPAWPAHFE